MNLEEEKYCAQFTIDIKLTNYITQHLLHLHVYINENEVCA